MMQHAIITGGSSGIGLALAKQLFAKGYHLTLIARDKNKLEWAIAIIKKKRVNSEQKIIFFIVDVTDEVSIKESIKESIDKLGNPSLLITSAGTSEANYFEKSDTALFKKMMDTNFFGTLYPIQAVVPFMKTAGAGHIVLLSSGCALSGIYGYTAYGSSKYALRGLAESLRAELKPYHIQVSIAFPPDTDTPQLIHENETKPIETKLVSQSFSVYSPDGVAKEILQGISKHKYFMPLTWPQTILSKFYSLIYPLINYYFDKRISDKTWINWGQTYHFVPEEILKPQNEEEIKQIIKKAKNDHKKIRLIGSFYSYTPLAATSHLLVSMENYKGLSSIDKIAQEVTVKTGTKLEELEKLLFNEGFALSNMGDINQQTVGGFISTGCHGTGKNLQGFSSNITKLKIITASGDTLNCSLEENPEIFKAAQVSLGSLGIITEVSLKIQPLYNVNIKKTRTSLTECLDLLDENFASNTCYEFFWFPYTDHVLEKRINKINSKVSSYQPFRFLNDYLVENGILWLICALSRKMPKFYRKTAHKWIPYILQDSSENVNGCGCYATPRLVKHFEIEYALPFDKGKEALIELKKLLNTHPTHVSFPIEVRCAKADDIYLSPSYDRDTIWIAVHAYIKDSYHDLFNECEKIFLSKKGRPHWGKLHSQTHEELKFSYEKWSNFHKVRDQLDQDRLFSNVYTERIFGDKN